MTDDDYSALLDARLRVVRSGKIAPVAALELAVEVAADWVEAIGSARALRRVSEALFGLSGELHRTGDEDRALKMEAQALDALYRAAALSDATALQVLRMAGGALCNLANQALEQGGDTILAGLTPAGRA